MKIGIIGSGHIGGALMRRFRAFEYDVSVSNSRGVASLTSLVHETGARAATVREAARENDVVVISIPLKRVEELGAGLFEGVSDQVIVVDTSNYYPRQRDGKIDAIEAGMTESGWVQTCLGRPVVKTFNTIIADHLRNAGLPEGADNRIALPVAGDGLEAKRTVMDLIGQIGFDAIDAGAIDESWRQQPGSPVYLMDYGSADVRRALGKAQQGRVAAWRATSKSPGTLDAPA